MEIPINWTSTSNLQDLLKLDYIKNQIDFPISVGQAFEKLNICCGYRTFSRLIERLEQKKLLKLKRNKGKNGNFTIINLRNL